MVEFGEALPVGREREQETKREWNRANRERKNAWQGEHPRRKNIKPFAGFDGEGWDTDEGEHALWILRAGEHELFTGKPLDIYEILAWMVELPRDVYYVGFSLGYDWGMILKHLPAERFRRLHDRESRTVGDRGVTFPVDWGPFRLDWIPGKRFTVSLAEDKSKRFMVEDCFGCFQQSFADAIEHWRIPTAEELGFIERMKAYRSEFRELAQTPEGLEGIREYNALECRLLARMMERVRDACDAQRINPTSWFGAGQLAQAILRKHKAKDTFGEFDQKFMGYSSEAYFGGFFDVSEVGIFPGMYEYDISSAYPHVMRTLPCLAHAELRPGNIANGRTLYRVRWSPKGGPTWGAFPLRHARGEKMVDGTEANFLDALARPSFTPGTLYYPTHGEGWYWDVEVAAVTARDDYYIEVLDAWTLVRKCDCEPFAWVPELFDYRKKLGKSGQGMVLKLGMNSLYGKLAQRVGRPQFANVCYAGMVTAGTRGMIHDAIRFAGPENIVMVATDAVYSRVPIVGLDVGEGLGRWEAKEFGEYIVILPGLHYAGDATKLKTRSIPLRVIRDSLERIRRHWYSPERWRPIEFVLEGFISNQLAIRLGKPEIRGEWRRVGRSIRFGSPDKRRIPYEAVEGDSVRLPLWENVDRIPSGHMSEWDYAEAIRQVHERRTGEPHWDSLIGDQPDFIDPVAIWEGGR